MQFRQSVLPGAENFSGSPQPQICLSDLKAVAAPAHNPVPLFGRFAVALTDQEAIRKGFSSAHTSAELMKLRKPETF